MEEMGGNNNPIEEKQYKTLQDKIKEWYIARGTVVANSLEQRGIDTSNEREFADLSSRQEKLEKIEKQDMSKLEKIQADIERFASAIGVQFDPATGEVYFGEKKAPNAVPPQQEELDATKDELSKTSREHSEVTQNLYGEDLKDPNFDPEKSKNPGIVAVVNQKKQDLMKRDASVKKLLAAKVRLEAAKDRMDMHGARHVAEKYRLMMMLEQLRLELVRQIALGGKETDLGVQNLRHQISGITNQIVSMENQFEAERGSYVAEFGAAKAELDNSVKSVEYDSKGSGGNKYSSNLTYSEDGILNGVETNGRRNDRQVEEKEIFDERGVMIFDVADVLSREKSINIDGIVVSCVTEFGPGKNVEDSFYIGEMEQLETNTNGAGSGVEEKPDMEEEVDNTETDQMNTISVFQRNVLRHVGYAIGAQVISSQADIANLTPDQRRVLNTALGGFGGKENAIYGTVVDLIKEGIEKEEELENPFEERKGPYDSSNNC